MEQLLAKDPIQVVLSREQVKDEIGWGWPRPTAAEKLFEKVTYSSKNYAVTRAYRGESGYIGSNLAAGSRGLVTAALNAVQRDRATRVREAYRLLMTPGASLPVRGQPRMMA